MKTPCAVFNIFFASILIFFFMFVPFSVAQDSSITSIFKELSINSSNVKGIEADFVQEKHISFMDEVVLSAGHFSFKAPQDITWEYKTPIASTLHYKDGVASIWQGDKMLGNQKETQHGPAIIAKILAENILLWTNPDLEQFENIYFIKILNQSPIVLHLVPRTIKNNSPIISLQITFAEDRSSVSQIILHEPADDYTKINFTNTALTH